MNKDCNVINFYDYYKEELQMLSVFDVAKVFLSLESMSNKKLQKLCYYAQAWHLAFNNGKRLFNSSFQAWVHGPVCYELYQEYKEYGFYDIPEESSIPSIVDEDEYEFLCEVYNTYGEFTGDQLETLTHEELPWIKARASLEEWEPSREEIDDNIMRDYYLKVYESSN